LESDLIECFRLAQLVFLVRQQEQFVQVQQHLEQRMPAGFPSRLHLVSMAYYQ